MSTPISEMTFVYETLSKEEIAEVRSRYAKLVQDAEDLVASNPKLSHLPYSLRVYEELLFESQLETIIALNAVCNDMRETGSIESVKIMEELIKKMRNSAKRTQKRIVEIEAELFEFYNRQLPRQSLGFWGRLYSHLKTWPRFKIIQPIVSIPTRIRIFIIGFRVRIQLERHIESVAALDLISKDCLKEVESNMMADRSKDDDEDVIT